MRWPCPSSPTASQFTASLLKVFIWLIIIHCSTLDWNSGGFAHRRMASARSGEWPRIGAKTVVAGWAQLRPMHAHARCLIRCPVEQIGRRLNPLTVRTLRPGKLGMVKGKRSLRTRLAAGSKRRIARRTWRRFLPQASRSGFAIARECLLRPPVAMRVNA